MTAMELATIEKIGNIQTNDRKEQVRQVLQDIAIDFAKKEKQPLRLLTLPADMWLFEKGLIRKAKQHGVTIKGIVGVEHKGKIAERVRANKPSGVNSEVVEGSFDDICSNKNGDFDPVCSGDDFGFFNLVWADYCGHVATVHETQNDYRDYFYKYPHIDNFVSYASWVVEEGKKAIFALTFEASGTHLVGKKRSLIVSMAGLSCQTLRAAIPIKVNQKLTCAGIKNKVHLMARIVYKGAKRSNMITLVYAIGFVPKTVIEKDWTIKKVQTAKTPKNVPIIWTTSKKAKHKNKGKLSDVETRVIKKLSDSGMANDKISCAMKLTRNQVGAVLAWHHHRKSWKG